MNKLTIGQETALGQLLSDWPENNTFDQIVFRLRNNDLYDAEDNEMEICVWELVQDWDIEFLADQIDLLAKIIDKRNLKAYGEIK